MKQEKTEGIVLRSFDYKERGRIITVFSSDYGMIDLVAASLSKKKSYLLSLTSPFSQGEFVFTRGKSTLYRFQDGTLINPHAVLRQKLSSLNVASQIIQAIILSQLPGKSALALYQMTLAYLKQVALFEDPSPLIVSFYLKLLKHEGLLQLQKKCSYCDQPACGLNQGASICSMHQDSDSLIVTSEEWMDLFILSEARQFQILKQISISPGLLNKIESCFKKCLP